MTQKFQADGRVVPVTVVEAGPCTVVQVKSKDKDSYNAVQVGFAIKKGVNKPLAGHLKNLENFRYLKEFRLDNVENFARAKVFNVSSFSVGDNLKVTATSKGKGFQGVVRRHGFHGSPATHGHKDQHRMPGSVGATDSARVFKGTRMGGHMGTDTVTVKNLELIEVDVDKNLLYIKGAVPGSRNALVTIWADGEITFVENLEQSRKVEKASSKVQEVKEEKIEEPKKEDNIETPTAEERVEDKASEDKIEEKK